jgi:hypothetical protein
MSPASIAATPSMLITDSDGSPPVTTMLRLEGLAVLAASLAAFVYLWVSWWRGSPYNPLSSMYHGVL